MGKHVVKTWSSTQSVIALSSGEAEYYGLVIGGSVGLGFQSMLGDLGIYRGLKLKTDASAAKGIANRRGLGKLRHIEVNQLWLQDKVAKGDLEVEKVDGKINRADALTKSVTGEQLADHRLWLSGVIVPGRHELMPELARGMVDIPDEGLGGEDEESIRKEEEGKDASPKGGTSIDTVREEKGIGERDATNKHNNMDLRAGDQSRDQQIFGRKV